MCVAIDGMTGKDIDNLLGSAITPKGSALAQEMARNDAPAPEAVPSFEVTDDVLAAVSICSYVCSRGGIGT